MINLGKLALSFLALPAVLLAASSASAFDTPAECGLFDFDRNSANCEIRVAAQCTAGCKVDNFTAGCQGGCTSMPDPVCIQQTCGAGCIADCDPAKLDCVQGCHDECEQPFIKDCEAAHPERDCVSDAVATCKGYCRDQCKVMPSSCIEHCDMCCTGACTSFSNMECNIDCYVKLDASCNASCSAPEGGLYCNGQYVNATNVNTCISKLAEQGINTNVEARGEVVCDLSGCHAKGDASAGGLACAASVPGQDSPFAVAALALGLAGAGISVARRRSRKNG